MKRRRLNRANKIIFLIFQFLNKITFSTFQDRVGHENDVTSEIPSKKLDLYEFQYFDIPTFRVYFQLFSKVGQSI